MTSIELIGILGSSASIAQLLSKFFLPPESIESDITMEYYSAQKYLEYNAIFKIPKPKRTPFRKKLPRVPLFCNEGFLSISSSLETDTDSKELFIPEINCSLPQIAGRENLGSLVGKRISLNIRINMDLTHRISCNWEPLSSDGHRLKATITNTMAIRVRNYYAITKLPAKKRLKKANLLINGTPKPAPIILNYNARVHSSGGNIEEDFPSLDTSLNSWISSDDTEKETEITIPIDILEKSQAVIVNLLFD